MNIAWGEQSVNALDAIKQRGLFMRLVRNAGAANEPDLFAAA